MSSSQSEEEVEDKKGVSLLPIKDTSHATTTFMELPSSHPRGIAIFSGGSAANTLVNVFNQVAEGQSPLSYVIPIS